MIIRMMLDTRFRALHALVVLAEELHFGRAARRLGIAQPHLSVQIRRLEAEVGAALFVRTPRVAPTAAGEAMLEAARRILAEVSAGVERARATERGVRGSLSVAFASTVMLTRLPGALREFRDHHPEIGLRLRELHSSEQIGLLKAGALDVGLSRETPKAGDGLEGVPLLVEPFVVVLNARHALAAKRSISLRELRGEPFILFPRPLASSMHDQIMTLCSSAGTAPRIEFEASEWHTISALVAEGFGVSIAPESVARLKGPGVVFRELAGTKVRTTLGAIRRADDDRAIVRNFVDFLQRRHAGRVPTGARDGRSPRLG